MMSERSSNGQNGGRADPAPNPVHPAPRWPGRATAARLGNAHGGGFDVASHAHARLQEAIDQSQQSGIRTAAFQPRHQPVMIDPIKEGLQVHVHHPAVASTDVRLHFAYGLMRRALWAKSVAVMVEA